MMVVVDIIGEAKQQIDKRLGDTGSSHHIRSTREGLINCPPGTKIPQVQVVVEVREWGKMLSEIDNADGKRILKLHETLIVPNNNVDLFSLHRRVHEVCIFSHWPTIIMHRKIDSEKRGVGSLIRHIPKIDI